MEVKNTSKNKISDNGLDAIAAVGIILAFVVGLSFWLSGMPS